MALCVNQSGTWRNITTQCVNQTSTWRKVLDSCVNQSGTWRCHGMTAPTVTLSASPTSVARSGGEGQTSTLTWSSTRTTSTSSNFGTTATSGTCVVGPSGTTTYCMCASNSFGTSSTSSATLTVTAPTLGSSFGGGFLICRASSVNWIVSPRSAEVSRTWYSRNDANTRAQQVSGCTGWFVPAIGQLQNPGLNCRDNWGTSPCYSCSDYWSCDEHKTFGSPTVCGINLYFPPNAGFVNCRNKTYIKCVRAFRCVTY